MKRRLFTKEWQEAVLDLMSRMGMIPSYQTKEKE